MSAPWSNKRFTALQSPFKTAWCNGVAPSLMVHPSVEGLLGHGVVSGRQCVGVVGALLLGSVPALGIGDVGVGAASLPHAGISNTRSTKDVASMPTIKEGGDGTADVFISTPTERQNPAHGVEAQSVPVCGVGTGTLLTRYEFFGKYPWPWPAGSSFSNPIPTHVENTDFWGLFLFPREAKVTVPAR